MATLTYRTELYGAVELGQPLGIDCTGWPYRVESILETGGMTRVELEPWPLLDPGTSEQERAATRAAMLYAARVRFGPCVP